MNTQLVWKIYDRLLGAKGILIKEAHQKENIKRKELKNEGKDKEQIDKELKAYRTKNLTYNESENSILERIDDDTYYQTKGNKKYFRKERFIDDMEKAKVSLLKLGIIKEVYETTGAKGNKMYNFVINENWTSEEAGKIKGILPPDDERLDGVEYTYEEV